MYNQTKYLKTIIEANKNKNLAVFVGAGISKSSDTNEVSLPSWQDLINELKQELSLENETDFLKIAELYYLAFGEYNYKNKIKEYFPENVEPSKVHRSIFELNPQIIITTNWDNLLEKTIEEHGYFYDIVKSDNDLVESQLSNKFIKMHGDFTNFNIVFKESDYINYSQNFPLIENYIKSILSTHVVLFLGYSYNDINLKQIISWIQYNSNARPPAYLVLFNENNIQKEYLKSYGINTLLIHNNKDKEFEYNNKMIEFLNDIKYQKYFKKYENDNQIIEYVLNRIIHLDELDALMLNHIHKSITNCRFIYDGNSRPILFFLDEFLSEDMDKELRGIYRKFTTLLKEIDENKFEVSKSVLKIFTILSKARIKGIVISEEDSKAPTMYIPFANYIEVDDNLNKYMNFQFNFDVEYEMSIESAYHSYNTMNYVDAYNKVEILIRSYTKQKKIVKLFILMFNRNILLRFFKTQLQFLNKKYLKEIPYDLKNKFDSLPDKYKLMVEPIFSYLSFVEFFQINFKVEQKLQKSLKNREIVSNGGYYWTAEPLEDRTNHINLLHFFFKNRLMIDNYNEFINLNKKYVFIAINEFSNEKEIHLERFEIYSCIKFFRKDELKKTFLDYSTADKTNKTIVVKDEDLIWLIESALDDVIKFLSTKGAIYEQYRQYFINIIYLFAHIKLNENQQHEVLTKISRLLEKGNNLIEVYNSINFYLEIQFYVYDVKFQRNDIIDIIEVLIKKIISKNVGNQEFDAIIKSNLYNLFNVISFKKQYYKNYKLVESLINVIKSSFDIRFKITVSQYFLTHIYKISNKKIKDRIESFLLEINVSEIESLLTKVLFSLHLAENEIKSLTKEDIDNLNDFLDEDYVSQNYDIQLKAMKVTLEKILEKKSNKSISNPLKKIKSMLDNK